MKINYKQIYYLLNNIPNPGGIDIKERLGIWVSKVSNGRTSTVLELDEVELRQMIVEMQETARRCNPELVKLETWRRRVIKAICEYHSLMGYYKNLTDDERVLLAKGEAVRAKGRGDEGGGNEVPTSAKLQTSIAFNRISVSELQALYNAKIRQNRIVRKANKAFEEDLRL
ncbi:MAG: hypothetical protein LBG28_14840 [Tannerella sp.]|jgi:hypothetical protein|nr:hypothetical protein [Tannerella sp.]